ncbi:MAG: hypothetical protein V4713_03660 [Pseudomonadota bacterium]
MSDSDQIFYDMTIKSIDIKVNQTVFETTDGLAKTFQKAISFHQVGSRGVLTVKTDGDFLFRAYPDPRLRRWPEQDIPANEDEGYFGAWSWRLDGIEDRITAKPGLIPGEGGRYIKDETDKVEIDIPPEFFQLCESRGITVEQALRGLIADVCGLQSYVNNPREDGFISNGSDERMYAKQWFDRAYFV